MSYIFHPVREPRDHVETFHLSSIRWPGAVGLSSYLPPCAPPRSYTYDREEGAAVPKYT